MSLIIDRKYISLVSVKLRNFKQKKDYLKPFRAKQAVQKIAKSIADCRRHRKYHPRAEQ